MTTEFLKVGVVGCGYVAQVGHIPALLKCRNVNLVAICDRDEDLARKVAGKFKIGKCYANFKEMLDSEKLDVVDICTSIKYTRITGYPSDGGWLSRFYRKALGNEYQGS